MITASHYALGCDACPARFLYEYDPQNPVAPTWQCLHAAKILGWTRFGEKDRCPACSAPPPSACDETAIAIRCSALGPEVEVIASTKFDGVPEGLMPEWGPAVDDPAYVAFCAQDHGSDGARLIETAGRTCYDSFGKGRSSADYHAHLLEVGHGSVLEHSSISFFITRASRNLTHELVRHRVGVAYSQRSTRYVDESESEIAWHPLLAGMSDAMQQNLRHWATMAQAGYHRICEELESGLRAQGLSETDARKQARGAARGVLPSALSTELVATFNLRALRHFIELRATDAADAEIRLLAWRLYRAAETIVPEFFSDYTVAPAKDGIGCVVTTPHRKV